MLLPPAKVMVPLLNEAASVPLIDVDRLPGACSMIGKVPELLIAVPLKVMFEALASIVKTADPTTSGRLGFK
jgi:hypothetical protein